jgi:hypothetical protein
MIIIDFITKQSKTELIMSSYVISWIIIVIIIFLLKKRNKNILIRKMEIFQLITILNTSIFLTISFLTKEMIQAPQFAYQIAICIISLVIYSILNGFTVKSIKGIEFGNAENTETLKQLLNYVELADKISNCMSKSIDTIISMEPVVVNDTKKIVQLWVYIIRQYLIERKITQISIKNCLEVSEESIKLYVKDIVEKNHLWYNDHEINNFVRNILLSEVINLSTRIKLIPVGDSLIYTESLNSLEKVDIEFLVNTYKIIRMKCFVPKTNEVQNKKLTKKQRTKKRKRYQNRRMSE